MVTPPGPSGPHPRPPESPVREQTQPESALLDVLARRTRSAPSIPTPQRKTKWKSSDARAAVRKFFRGPRRLSECRLARDLISADPVAHRRAAEMARLIGRREPGALSPYANLLTAAAAAWPLEEWQARQYALVAAALAAETHTQRMSLLPRVRMSLEENRIAVRAMALEAFAILAVREPELRGEALEILRHARHSSIAALRARARLMLPILLKAGSDSKGAESVRKK